MKPMTTLIAACALSSLGQAGAQQAETGQEPGRQGVPVSPHQEQALRGVGSDLFERRDANHDGAVSKQEAQNQPSLAGSWSEYDRNGDQVLDQAEFSAFETSATSSTESESEAVGQGQGGSQVEGLPASPHQKDVVRNELLGRLDKDGDGALSRGEAQGEVRLMDQWDRLDRNGDGKLDSSELSQFTQ
jgi:hypothetical protein